MAILSATSVSWSFGDRLILDRVSLSLDRGERIGLVGRNGAGKSTLLRMLEGVFRPTDGTVSLASGARAGYLAQDPDIDREHTVREVADGAFAHLRDLHGQLETIYHDVGDAEGESLDKLLRRQGEIEKRIEAAGGYETDHRLEAVLHGLGFTDSQFDLPASKLSGGQLGRLALARLLLTGPDVLLLDEPTNHLDLDGRLWLEDFLVNRYTGAVVLISHDRYLLDNVVSRIVEVEDGRLIDYPGNYHKFRELRAERRQAQARAWEKQQSRFKKEEAFIRKYKAGQRAKQAKGRESRLERTKAEESIERPLDAQTARFSFPKPERTGDMVASGRGLTKAYQATDGSTKRLFEDLDITIERGERWGIVGPNGAGKTTLVRCLLGELEPDAGSVRLGSNVVVGHLHQTYDNLPMERPLFRFIQDQVKAATPDKILSEQEARNLAGAFLFSGEAQEKPLAEVSGGERVRAVLAGLLASSKNLIVLDEPTNHLDIPSTERLEESLSKSNPGSYEGTVILISHDRALVDAVCDHLVVLDGHGGAKVVLGNWSEWRQRQSQRAREAAERDLALKAQADRAPNTPAATPAPASKKPKGDAGKNPYSWMPMDKLESRIAEVESSVKTIDAQLADPEVWTRVDEANRLTEERDRLKGELEPLEMEWLRRME